MLECIGQHLYYEANISSFNEVCGMKYVVAGYQELSEAGTSSHLFLCLITCMDPPTNQISELSLS